VAKIKLNLDENDTIPPITAEVEIPTPQGKALKVKFDFVYRDREAMAEFSTSLLAKSQRALEKARASIAEANAESDEGVGEFDRKLVQDAMRRDVEMILDVATGWNVDLPFDETTLGVFVKRYAGAPSAIYEEYKHRMTEGKRGNL
jgi:hypothetical protein